MSTVHYNRVVPVEHRVYSVLGQPFKVRVLAAPHRGHLLFGVGVSEESGAAGLIAGGESYVRSAFILVRIESPWGETLCNKGLL